MTRFFSEQDKAQTQNFNFAPQIANKFDCEVKLENIATFDFNSKILKLGKATLSTKQLDRIAFLLAVDIKSFATVNGNFSNLSANDIYAHLQNNQ